MKTSILLVGAYPDRQVQKKLPWVLWQTVWFPQMKFAPIWHSSLSVKENSYTENHVPEKYIAIQNSMQQIEILWCEYVYVNVIEVIFFMLLGGRRLWIFTSKKKAKNRHLTKKLIMGTLAKSCITCTCLAPFFTTLVEFLSQVASGYRVWEVRFPVSGILLRLWDEMLCWQLPFKKKKKL